MYRAVCDFVDLEDENRLYHAGDVFPRDGFTVTPARVAELKGHDNKAGKPLIEETQEPKPRRKKR